MKVAETPLTVTVPVAAADVEKQDEGRAYDKVTMPVSWSVVPDTWYVFEPTVITPVTVVEAAFERPKASRRMTTKESVLNAGYTVLVFTTIDADELDAV